MTVSTPADTPTTTVAPDTTTTAGVVVTNINEINEDGTYTVGFEASDGTFKKETKDAEGNVKGTYGFLDKNGELQVVEYSSNNSTGFITNSTPEQVTAVLEEDPAFKQERARHAAVLAHQKSVIEKQKQIQEQNNLAVQRQNFANHSGQGRRPVFNAARFNPEAPIDQQFDRNAFNQDFNQFNQRQQQQQFAPQQQQQFAPQQQQQFVPQQQQQFPQQQPQQQFQQQPQFQFQQFLQQQP